MKTMKKRAVSILLLIAMALSMIPATVFSAVGAESVTLVSDYDSLVTALNDAVATDKIIIVGDITIPTGKTLSVPKGVRLIIGYNSKGEYGGHTADDYEGDSTYYTSDFSGDDPVYTVTVEKGAALDVYGSLYVGGKLVASSGSKYQGATGTLYSKLICNGDVNIIDGSLYCYGYIGGDGNINSSGSSSVYAPFVIGNFNGGGYIYGLYKVGKVSPINEYVMPNISAKLTVKYGTSVYGLCALFSGGSVNVSTPKMVGTSQALIVLENSESGLVAQYKENDSKSANLSGKLCLDFYGSVKAGDLFMEIYYTPISTADVVFPIPYCFNLNVKQGATLKTDNKYALLPGACLTIEQGGEFVVEEKGELYILDGMKETQSVGYVYPYTSDLAANNYSQNAELTVEGKLSIKDGGLFAGVVKNVKPGAVVDIAQNVKLSGSYVSGIAANYNINFTDYAYYNKTEYSLKAKALSISGEWFDLEAGKTYYCADPRVTLDVNKYEYIYYGTLSGAKPQVLKDNISFTATGSLNTFAVVYNYADGSKQESYTTTLAQNTNGYVWYNMYTGEVVTSVSQNGFFMLGESNRYVTFKDENHQISLVVGSDGVIPTPDFSKEHYELTGWSKTLGGKKDYSLGQKADFTTAVLYPVWTALKYNVTYVLTPENYEFYNDSYLYIDDNGNYVIKVESVEYNTPALNAPDNDIMGRDELYFEWNGNLSAITGDITVFGEYFEYGVRNLRTGVVHTSLEAAIENAQDGDTLRIQQSTEESVVIEAGKKLTIDLNGFELHYSSGSVITNNGQLTLIDSREGGAVVQYGKGVSTSNVYYALTNNSGATLTIDGADLVSNIDGTNTRTLYNQGKVIFNSGVISSNAGYTVYNFGKNPSDGVFVQNGGAIKYSGTSSSSYGVYNYNKASYTLNGGSIEAVSSGRAFYNWLNSTLTVNGGSISSATGGVLYNNGGNVYIYGGTLTTNSLATLTYVITNTKYASVQSVINIYGGTISAPKGCRGINNQKSTINMFGGRVETTGNTNYSWGIYNNDSATLNIYGGSVYAKSSHAVYNYSATSSAAPSLNIYGGHIVSEAASGYYAVITGYNSKYGKVTVSGGNFASNSANAIYTASANSAITVTADGFGGLYKYKDAPINSYTSVSAFTMQALSASGVYSGYYCMTSADKAYEASVGSTKYKYISQALAEAEEGEIIILLSNVKLNGTAYPEGIIDLAGHTLDISSNILDCDKLYIKDSVGGGKIKGYTDDNASTLLYSGEVEFVAAEKDGDIFLGYSADGSTNYIVSPVNKGELVIYPVYASNAKFTVVFEDEQGNIISSKEYSYGEKITIPAAPAKSGDNVYEYIFSHWGGGLEELCYSNKVYSPVYSTEYVKYIINFYDNNGKNVLNGTFHYGESVIAPIVTEKIAKENSYFLFKGWSDGETVYTNTEDIPAVSDNIDYTAVYSEIPYENVSDSKVRLSSATVVFESSLTINFRAKLADLEGFDQLFVVFERTYADGSNVTYTEWNYRINGDYIVFPYSNIAAKEMGDAVNATLYAIKGEERYSYTTVQYSILKYATNLLGKSSTNKEFKTVLVDMLNYGSAAQKYFNYNEKNLVNSGLTEAQKNLASWNGGDISLTTVKAYDRLENETAKFNSVSLVFEDAVTVKYIMDLSKYTEDKSKLSFVIRYTNSIGQYCEEVVAFEDFVENGNYHTVSFSGVPIKDMSIALSATIYRDYGSINETAVSGTTTYSVESYAYSKANSTDGDLAYLVKAMVAFGRSTYSYLVD